MNYHMAEAPVCDAPHAGPARLRASVLEHPRSHRETPARVLRRRDDETVALEDHRRRVDLPGTLDVAADVLRMDRDQLASAVGVRTARDRALEPGIEPSTEDRRARLDVRRIARIGNEQGVNPV